MANYITSNICSDSLSRTFISLSSTVTKEASINEHFHVPISIIGHNQATKTHAMIDSRVSTLFISQNLVTSSRMMTQKYQQSIRLLNIDGTDNKAGFVTNYVVLVIEVGGVKMEEIFTVSNICSGDVIIGIDWLRHHDPKISFKNGTMEIPEKKSLTAYATTEEEESKERKIREKLPEHYWKYIDIFRKSRAESLPEHSASDCAINLKPDFVPTKAKTHPLSQPQREALEVWIADQLQKGYICPLKSPMSSPFFWVQKPGTTGWIDARPCQDYRKLNKVTIKDNYPMVMV